VLTNAPRPHDRRSIQRQPGSPGPIKFTTVTGDTVVAHVQDISIQGIGFLTNRFLNTGTLLQLPDRGIADDTRSLVAEVKRATKQSDDQWLVGCAFSRLLSAEDALRLI
jgi:hypothetical protein